jgi:hypothetical protein
MHILERVGFSNALSRPSLDKGKLLGGGNEEQECIQALLERETLWKKRTDSCLRAMTRLRPANRIGGRDV